MEEQKWTFYITRKGILDENKVKFGILYENIVDLYNK